MKKLLIVIGVYLLVSIFALKTSPSQAQGLGYSKRHPSPSTSPSVSPSPNPTVCTSPALVTSPYDQAVLTSSPVAYWAMDGTGADLSGCGHALNTVGNPGVTTAPNGDPAAVVGPGNYFQAADSNAFSISTTGQLTVETWIRADTLDFTNTTNSCPDCYVYWIGKGTSNQYEWAFRMYNKNSSRPNWLSSYAWNLAGNLGSGNTTKDFGMQVSTWYHIVGVYDFPADRIYIYKNGVYAGVSITSGSTGTFTQYKVIPQNGTAPLMIGTRDLSSFFQGGISKVAIYNRALSATEIAAHYAAM